MIPADSVFSFIRRTLPILAVLFSVPQIAAAALEQLDDEAMESVSGQGLAFSVDDFRFRYSPTSYVHAVGSGTGTDAFHQADMYWYGAVLGSDEPVAGWMGGCAPGIAGLGCPVGGRLQGFATHDNPFLLRVFEYSNHPSGALIRDFQGAVAPSTIFEILWPTNQEAYKYAFWGELAVIDGNGANAGDPLGTLQVQTVLGNTRLSTDHDPVTGLGKNTKIRILQNTDVNDPTFALIYHNHYQGNMRISVAQEQFSPGIVGLPPVFNSVEGFYTMNTEVFFPMGQLAYQSVIFKDSGNSDGNFSIHLTRIPNVEAVYDDFYSFMPGDTQGYETARNALISPSSVPEHYFETHGYVKVGDITTTNGIDDLTDGVIFHSASPSLNSTQFTASASRPETGNLDSNNTPAPESYAVSGLNHVNLGDVRISGMTINNLEIITLGAQ